MSKPMTVARYAREHRGWFYGCLLLFALVAFFCLKAIYDMTVYGAKAPLYAFIAGMVGFGATALGSLPGFYLHKLSQKAAHRRSVEGDAVLERAGQFGRHDACSSDLLAFASEY